MDVKDVMTTMNDDKARDEAAVTSSDNVVPFVDPQYLIPLRRPISWGGKMYNQLDLSGLETLCAEDLSQAHRAVLQVSPTTLLPMSDPLYSRIIISAITGIPEVMLKTMDARDALKAQSVVTSFLNN